MRLALIPAAAVATLALAGGTAHAAFNPPEIIGGTLTVVGDGASDTLEIRRDPADATKVQVDVGDDGNAEGTFAISAFQKIDVAAGGGNDTVRVDEAGNNDPIAPVAIDGGEGNDDLNGSQGVDVITGGGGDDKIDGDRGNDTQQGQNGNDTITWDPGDGNDVVDGGAGDDLHRFNGANNAAGTSEIITVKRSAVDGSRVELLRNLANIDMDIVSAETVEVVGKGGVDELSGGPDLAGLTKLRLFGGDPAAPDAPSAEDVLTGSDSDDLLSGGDGNDALAAGLGVDVVDGGAGVDAVSCGGQVDDVVVNDRSDQIDADCFIDPPVKNDPPAPVVEQPKGGETKVESKDVATAAPVVRAAALPQPVAIVGRAFSTPRISGSFRALRVSVTNTSSRSLDLAIGASDAGYAYRAKRRRIAPGETYTVVLRAPAALRGLIARKARKTRIVRRPKVRIVDLATNQSLTVTPRIRVAKGAR